MSQWSKERPLAARSVLASALLGTEPPELTVAQLVRLAGLFGINENRARVALSRMVAAGEAVSDGAGRYRLAGPLLERQQRQRVSRTGSSRRWRGQWVLVVLTGPAAGAAVRAARRTALGGARLGELRDGVWVRPDNLDVALPEGVDAVVAHGPLQLPMEEQQRLVGALWDLAGWAGRAHELLARMAALPPDGPDALAPGFVLSAAVLRHLQADPLLPSELAPATWPAAELRAAYEPWDRAYRAQLSAWHRISRP
jgi:phenylacetic acid degradation operon negative regulatory protein